MDDQGVHSKPREVAQPIFYADTQRFPRVWGGTRGRHGIGPAGMAFSREESQLRVEVPFASGTPPRCLIAGLFVNIYG